MDQPTKEQVRQLVELAKQGDNKAFEELFYLTREKGYYTAYKFVKSEDVATDILQDSYLKAYSHIANIYDSSKFESWFYMIVANTAKSWLAKNKPMYFGEMESDGDEDYDFEDTIENEDDSLIPQEVLESNTTKQLVLNAINKLPEEQRLCIMMFYYNGMQIGEIATALTVPEGTVKSRLFKAKKTLKEEFIRLDKEENTKLYSIPFVPFMRVIFNMDLFTTRKPSLIDAGNMFKRIMTAMGRAPITPPAYQQPPMNQAPAQQMSAQQPMQEKPSGIKKPKPAKSTMIGNTGKKVAVTEAAKKTAGASLFKKVIAGVLAVAIIGTGAGFGITNKDKILEMVNRDKQKPAAVTEATDENLPISKRYKIGDELELGYYPQSLVTDEELISRLDEIEPGNYEASNYQYLKDVDFSYHSGDVTDMTFNDIPLDNEKYRRVEINEYRLLVSTGVGDGEEDYYNEENDTYYNRNQECNGYTKGNTYYFKWEPVVWTVVGTSKDHITCISKTILDSQSVDTDERTIGEEGWLDDHLTARFQINDVNVRFANRSGIEYFALPDLNKITEKDTDIFDENKNNIEIGAYGSDYAKAQGLHVFGNGGNTKYQDKHYSDFSSYYSPEEGSSYWSFKYKDEVMGEWVNKGFGFVFKTNDENKICGASGGPDNFGTYGTRDQIVYNDSGVRPMIKISNDANLTNDKDKAFISQDIIQQIWNFYVFYGDDGSELEGKTDEEILGYLDIYIDSCIPYEQSTTTDPDGYFEKTLGYGPNEEYGSAAKYTDYAEAEKYVKYLYDIDITIHDGMKGNSYYTKDGKIYFYITGLGGGPNLCEMNYYNIGDDTYVFNFSYVDTLCLESLTFKIINGDDGYQYIRILSTDFVNNE